MEIGLTRAELEAAWGYALGAEMPRVAGYLHGALETVPEIEGVMRFVVVDDYAVEILAVISTLAEARTGVVRIGATSEGAR